MRNGWAPESCSGRRGQRGDEVEEEMGRASSIDLGLKKKR